MCQMNWGASFFFFLRIFSFVKAKREDNGEHTVFLVQRCYLRFHETTCAIRFDVLAVVNLCSDYLAAQLRSLIDAELAFEENISFYRNSMDTFYISGYFLSP